MSKFFIIESSDNLINKCRHIRNTCAQAQSFVKIFVTMTSGDTCKCLYTKDTILWERTTQNRDLIICVTTTRGRRGRDCMMVGFKTTYAIGAYHH